MRSMGFLKELALSGGVQVRDAFYGNSQKTQLIDTGVYISLLTRSLELAVKFGEAGLLCF